MIKKYGTFLIFVTFVLGFGLPTWASDTGSPTVIKMKRHVNIARENIELGDLADIVSSDSNTEAALVHLVLDTSPQIDGSVNWTAEDVSKRLRPYHDLLEKAVVTIPEQISITRRADSISEIVGAKVLAMLKATLSDSSWEVNLVELQVPENTELRPDETILVVPITTRPRGAAQFEVQFLKDGKMVSRKWMNGRVSYFANVATVQRVIEVHSRFTETDLVWSRKEITFTADVPATKSDVLTANARVTIQPGSLLTRSMLEREMALHYGEEVELLAGEDTFSIKAKAIAQQNGYVGDLVKVKFSNSPKILTALVLSRGVVRVQY